VCGPHGVVGKKRERERIREKERVREWEGKCERGRCLSEFTHQASVDLGQDLASLI
jgi:hypothetical protein